MFLRLNAAEASGELVCVGELGGLDKVEQRPQLRRVVLYITAAGSCSSEKEEIGRVVSAANHLFSLIARYKEYTLLYSTLY